MHEMVFTRRFSMAHRLMSDKSPKCQNVHGHNVEVKVYIGAAQWLPAAWIKDPHRKLDLDVNMIEEFGAAKKLWHTWIDEYVDHGIQLNQNDTEFRDLIQRLVPHTRMLLTPGDPTMELCCVAFMAKCNAFLMKEHKGTLKCNKIILVETPTNTVTFDGNPHDHLSDSQDFWWNRADMTANDL